MKSYIDYGAWINDKHYPMQRSHWLAAIRLTFGLDISDIKEQITKNRREACRFPGYKPGRREYSSNRIAAYYHITGPHRWYYIQKYGPETAICITVHKYITDILQEDPAIAPEITKNITREQLNHPERWGVCPNLKISPWHGQLLIDDLVSVNYHTKAAIFADILDKHMHLLAA